MPHRLALPRPAHSRLVVAASALALATVLSGCGGPEEATTWHPTPAPQAQGALGAGFWDDDAPPAPESTLTPAPDSWKDLRPELGYRVVLLVDGVPGDHAPQTAVLRRAVEAWADEVDAEVTELVATKPTEYVGRIRAAIAARADLVIGVGNGLTDPLALVTASHLDRQFLLVGSELAEPTANVTAADWVGAMYRGEGLGLPEDYDPTTFTPERAGRAVRAGVAAVLGGLTGIVVQVG